MSSDMEAKEFKEVLKDELNEIGHSRELREASLEGFKLPPVSDSQDAYQKAAESGHDR